MTDPVRIGILGCAAVAEYALIAPAAEDTGIIASAVASRSAVRAQEYAKRNNIPQTYSYEDLLNAPDLDAIYIALPNSMHCEWTIRALQAGKPVLCEKPLASNEREALLMAEEAKKTGVELVEAFHWLYHPLAARMKEIVDSGALGKIQSVGVRFLIPNHYVGKNDIRLQYDLGGGSTMDAGCYCISLLRLLLGEPERVLSAVPTLYSELIDASMRVELQFPDAIGRLHCSHFHDGKKITMDAIITGTNGTLRVLHPFTPQWGNSLEIEIGGKFKSESVTTASTYYFQAKHFARVIREGIAVKTPASGSILNMRVIDDIYRHAGMKIRGN